MKSILSLKARRRKGVIKVDGRKKKAKNDDDENKKKEKERQEKDTGKCEKSERWEKMKLS